MGRVRIRRKGVDYEGSEHLYKHVELVDTLNLRTFERFSASGVCHGQETELGDFLWHLGIGLPCFFKRSFICTL